MFCSSGSLFNCFFTRWKKVSIGVISGILGGIGNIQTTILNILFFAFKKFWIGSPSCRNNFPQGFLPFSKFFQNEQACPVNCSSYCLHRTASWPWAMTTLSLFYPQSPLFFLLWCILMQNSDCLWHSVAVVDLT